MTTDGLQTADGTVIDSLGRILLRSEASPWAKGIALAAVEGDQLRASSASAGSRPHSRLPSGVRRR